MKGQEEPQQGRRECSKDKQELEQVVHAWPSSLPHTLTRRRIQSHCNNSVGSVVRKQVQTVGTYSVGDSSRCRDSNSSARSSSRSEDSTGTSRSPTVTGTRSCPGLQIPQTPTLELKKKEMHNGVLRLLLLLLLFCYNGISLNVGKVTFIINNGHEQNPRHTYFICTTIFLGSYSHSTSVISFLSDYGIILIISKKY